MSSCIVPQRQPADVPLAVEERLSEADRRYEGLQQTATLAGEAWHRWQSREICVVGVGNVGSRLAQEIVRSGARVLAIDPDRVSARNLGNQAFATAGSLKAESIVGFCNAIRPGAATAWATDVRRVGVGELARVDVLVDCTDDGNLESLFTDLSNGLGLPHLRVAVDGSGERELGRVQLCHGGGGGACRLCAKSAEDMLRTAARTPCPGAAPAETPTLAGNAIALCVAGVALLQLQRLLGGVATERVLNTQLVVDLDHSRVLELKEHRREECLSGHIVWDLTRTAFAADETTFEDLFAEAARQLGEQPDSLECYGHALCTSAHCGCGSSVAAVGTRWAEPPRCGACRLATEWDLHTARPYWTRADAAREKILGRTASQLGMPRHGAMLIARRQHLPPKRFLLL